MPRTSPEIAVTRPAIAVITAAMPAQSVGLSGGTACDTRLSRVEEQMIATVQAARLNVLNAPARRAKPRPRTVAHVYLSLNGPVRPTAVRRVEG